uniref:Indoleamine 2,3-dioxygenase n=1 Tax=Podospora anserina (strain S / ATCC MYA-4624 / DSM 980 / FGSC 10383) TaxID=515849 RepID=A0A090CHU2_PODAN|nr:Putative protein of unknown function [Podospora anserina S mat+]
MGSLSNPVTPFNVLTDAKPDDTSLPAFMVSTTRGFLPRADPIVTLPPEFDPLESILQRMPVKTASGEPGLLAEGKLGNVVLSELPDLTSHIDKYAPNLPLMNALYRDYSFLLSAFLLEPCHLRFIKGEPYGLARDVLPANIARPIKRCAELYDTPSPPSLLSLLLTLLPQKERASNPSWNTPAPTPSTTTASPTPPLASPTPTSASSARSSTGSTPPPPRQASCSCTSPWFNTALGEEMLTALRNINRSMETMWQKSKPGSYTSFRTFIFGITSQSMFPHGVLYEGIEEYKGERQSFRGESGANDSMIPLMDSLLSIPMPETPLTEILKDFRQYRPSNHRDFIKYVAERQDELGIKRWALGGEEKEEEGRETRRLWLRLLDQVREFRWRHWCFAREYILKQTSHPTATGGSPIVTWLPNQLGAVLAEMEKIYGEGGGRGKLGEEIEGIMDLVGRQREMLEKEVRKFCEDRGVN